jgi:hypothetical protein
MISDEIGSSTTSSNASDAIMNERRLKMDPNYKWLLKDLNLNNNKRVIDVTAMLDDDEETSSDLEDGEILEEIIADHQHHEQEEDFSESDDNSNNYESDQEKSGSDDKITSKSRSTADSQDDKRAHSFDEEDNNNNNVDNTTSKCLNQVSFFSNSHLDADEIKEDITVEENEIAAAVRTTTKTSTTSQDIEPESELESDDDHKQDVNFISELYQKFMFKSGVEKMCPLTSDEARACKNDNESTVEKKERGESDQDEDQEPREEEEEEEDEESYYSQWSKQFQVKNGTHEDADTLNNNKEIRNKFSKSFEVNLEDLDILISRVDNGIKFKRNNDIQEEKTVSIESNEEPERPLEPKLLPEPASSNENNSSINSLKQEWSCMFSKLESDYKQKLQEQEKLNELKLEERIKEMKESLLENQQDLFMKQQQQLSNSSKANQELQMKSTYKVIASDSNEHTTATEVSGSTNQIVENAKYISNLRLELKAKHARHVQDLKDYYEKEIEALKLNKPNLDSPAAKSESNGSEQLILNIQQKNADQVNLNSELKNANNSLLKKLYENAQQIQYLTHDNFELKSKISEYDNALKSSREKITNLEHCCTQLELQLTETIKLQDQYMRELHLTQKNAMRKMQECEELKMNAKINEQKSYNYELKLDERDNQMTRLKTKLIQKDTDLTRIEYELQKERQLVSKLTMQLNQLNLEFNSELRQLASVENQINLAQSQQLANSNTSTSQSKVNTPRVKYSSNNNLNSNSSSLSNLSSYLKYSSNVDDHEDNYDYDNESKSHELDTKEPQQHNSIQQKNLSTNTQNQFNTSSTNPFANAMQIYHHHNQNQSPKVNNNGGISSCEDRIIYAQNLENEFDMLMKHKLNLDAQLTRLPFKATNTSMHTIRENIESDLSGVEKKLDSVKLELRKLNIIKTH